MRLGESCGVALKKHGKDYLGLCPFHDDKEPSLVVSPDKNLWHCLGACGEGGDVIQWVMGHQGVGFPHAVQILRDGAELNVTSGAARSQKRHLEPVLSDPVET